MTGMVQCQWFWTFTIASITRVLTLIYLHGDMATLSQLYPIGAGINTSYGVPHPVW